METEHNDMTDGGGGGGGGWGREGVGWIDTLASKKEVFKDTTGKSKAYVFWLFLYTFLYTFI